MSLILEALRKSEDERRRGQAPGLFVEQVRVPVRDRARTPAWAWALMLLLAGVTAVCATGTWLAIQRVRRDFTPGARFSRNPNQVSAE